MLEEPRFDPEGVPQVAPTDLPTWFLPSQPTAADREVVERVLRLEGVARESALRLRSATSGATDLARLEALGSDIFGQEVFARASHANGLRAVLALVGEILAQDRAACGHERSEAMEHAVHDVAAAMGVNRRTAEIRIEEAMLLAEVPRTLALLHAGFLPIPAARELGRRLAGQPEPLRTAVEARVLDTLGGVALLALGTGDLDELALTAQLEPSIAATVSAGASRPRVRDLAARALRELTPGFEVDGRLDGRRVDSPVRATKPRPGDVEFWPTRPGFCFVGAEMRESDATQVLERNDQLARRARRAGDPRPLPELRLAWFRDLLLAESGGQPMPGGGPSDDGGRLGLQPVPVHLTVHLLDGRTAVDGERLGPISPETLSELMTAARDTGGRIRVRPVQMPQCGGHAIDVHGAPIDPGPYEPPEQLRDSVIARDRTCRFPGCQVPARRCDLDHSIPHPRGPTCGCNLACLCRGHHRLKTSGRWRLINRGEGRLTWIGPTGRTYEVQPDPL